MHPIRPILGPFLLLNTCTLLTFTLGCSPARDHANPVHEARSSGPPAKSMQLPVVSSNVAAVAPTPSESATLAAPQPPPPAIRQEDAPYTHFFPALRDLEQKNRKDHVRIVWLGDSHGASDFWSGGLRRALQKRFGNGGLGFVHLGYAAYRHDGVKHSADGKWRIHPSGPATVTVTADGVYGLGGIFFSPDSAPTKALLTITDTALTSKLTWDLCYRLNTNQDQLSVTLTGTPQTTLTEAPEQPLGRISHTQFISNGPQVAFGVTPTSGAPQLCGVVIETDPAENPGIVLDTLGINGARLATPLAWNEASWASELARRSPTLVILEYGTNESGDIDINPTAYHHHLSALMSRIRKVKTDVDCLALAPTDRKDTPERTPLVRDAIREAAKTEHCGFWDTYEVMGGKGSIERWSKEEPPRAAKDGVHLNSRGYRELGGKLAEDILRSFKP